MFGQTYTVIFCYISIRFWLGNIQNTLGTNLRPLWGPPRTLGSLGSVPMVLGSLQDNSHRITGLQYSNDLWFSWNLQGDPYKTFMRSHKNVSSEDRYIRVSISAKIKSIQTVQCIYLSSDILWGWRLWGQRPPNFLKLSREPPRTPWRPYQWSPRSYLAILSQGTQGTQ